MLCDKCGKVIGNLTGNPICNVTKPNDLIASLCKDCYEYYLNVFARSKELEVERHDKFMRDIRQQTVQWFSDSYNKTDFYDKHKILYESKTTKE